MSCHTTFKDISQLESCNSLEELGAGQQRRPCLQFSSKERAWSIIWAEYCALAVTWLVSNNLKELYSWLFILGPKANYSFCQSWIKWSVFCCCFAPAAFSGHFTLSIFRNFYMTLLIGFVASIWKSLGKALNEENISELRTNQGKLPPAKTVLNWVVCCSSITPV